MFAFGKRLHTVEHDIIAFDILFKQSRHIVTINKDVDVFVNLQGEIVTPNRHYTISLNKVRLNRKKMDKGLYQYKYGYKTFSKKPNKEKGSIIVPVIIPKGAHCCQNIFGSILSTEVIYPNKFQ